MLGIFKEANRQVDKKQVVDFYKQIRKRIHVGWQAIKQAGQQAFSQTNHPVSQQIGDKGAS